MVQEVYNRVNGMGVSMSMGGVRRLLSQLLFADDTTLMAESAVQL